MPSMVVLILLSQFVELKLRPQILKYDVSNKMLISPLDVQIDSQQDPALLCLLGLGHLLLAPALGGLRTALSVKTVVPPSERAGIVADKLLVVGVVVVGAGPEGQEVVQTPGELVT